MTKRYLSVICLVPLTACAELGSSYQPILDGQPNHAYQADLQSCQDLARSQPYSADMVGAMIAGGAVGGLVGDHETSVTAAEGAGAGALFGLVGAMFEQIDARKSIVIECMKGRGHLVVG